MDSIFLVTPPAIEPVSLADAKNQLRVEQSFTDDDALIQSLIQSARMACENFTGRVFVQQQWQQNMDTFPYNPLYPSPSMVNGFGVDPTIYLKRAPVLSVDSINYTDTLTNPDTLPPTWYLVSPNSIPPRIYPAYGYYWPPTLAIVDAVNVLFTCGYAAGPIPTGGQLTENLAAANIPAPILSAIKQTVSWFYARPESDMSAQNIDLPFVAKALLTPYRMFP